MCPTHIGHRGMRTIRNLFVVAMLCIVGVSTVNAQNYLLDFGPGSPSWCYQMQQQINEIERVNAALQAQIMNYYNQQAAAATMHLMTNPFTPMAGALTYDGAYITPENVNNYTRERVACEHCSGGYNYRDYYMGGGEVRSVKQRCSFCHGTGTVMKTIFHD